MIDMGGSGEDVEAAPDFGDGGRPDLGVDLGVGPGIGPRVGPTVGSMTRRGGRRRFRLKLGLGLRAVARVELLEERAAATAAVARRGARAPDLGGGRRRLDATEALHRQPVALATLRPRLRR